MAEQKMLLRGAESIAIKYFAYLGVEGKDAGGNPTKRRSNREGVDL